MTNPPEAPSSQAMIAYDTPAKVELYKRSVLYTALVMQARGLRIGRVPRTALQVLARDYGLTFRTAKAALPAAAKLVLDQQAIVQELETPR